MQKTLQVVEKKNRKYVADAVAFVHGLWLALVVSSLPLSFTRKRFRHIGASMIAITVGSWVVFRDCPLYQLENMLRKKYDPKHSYTGSFTGHYLKKYFGLTIPAKIFTIAGTSYAAIMMMLESYDYIYHHSRTASAH
jgi:hypothetical protein